jgi:hypothetical protein
MSVSLLLGLVYRISESRKGIAEIEGKTTRVGASEWSRGDPSDIDGQNRKVEIGGRST